MDKYKRILVIIFFLALANLGLSFFIILKLDTLYKARQPISLPTISPSPVASIKPVDTINSDIKSDLTLIKAEIRSLREILGTTKSFEELSNLIKNLNSSEP